MSAYTLQKNTKWAAPAYDLIHSARGTVGCFCQDSRLGHWEFESAEGTISTKEEASAIVRAFDRVPTLHKNKVTFSKL